MRETDWRGSTGFCGRRGFTFLEIMFVVVIIGILLAIVGPRLVGRSQKARIGAAHMQLKNIQTALQQYEMHIGSFPDTNQGLKALLEKPSDVDEKEWDGPYLEGTVLPRDPWGNEFQYKEPGEHTKDYDLWSYGPDKQDNTADDVKNWTDEQK